jgi:hypothetical protein
LNALWAWRDDIRQEVTDWVAHIKIASDVGAKLSAALFNKETETICQQLAKSAELAPARTILLNSGPSQTRLFSDDKRIVKAMEAADKQRPYSPKSTFNRSRGFKRLLTRSRRPPSLQLPRNWETLKAVLFPGREEVVQDMIERRP